MFADTFARVRDEFVGYFVAPEPPSRTPHRTDGHRGRSDGTAGQVYAKVVPLTVSPAARAAALLVAVLLLVALVTVPLAQGLEDRIAAVQSGQLGS